MSASRGKANSSGSTRHSVSFPQLGHCAAAVSAISGEAFSSASSINCKSCSSNRSASSPARGDRPQRRAKSRRASAPGSARASRSSCSPVGTAKRRGPRLVTTATSAADSSGTRQTGCARSKDRSNGAPQWRQRASNQRMSGFSRAAVHCSSHSRVAQGSARTASCCRRPAADAFQQRAEKRGDRLRPRCRCGRRGSPRRVRRRRRADACARRERCLPCRLAPPRCPAPQVSAGSAVPGSRTKPSCWMVIDWIPTVFMLLASSSGSAVNSDTQARRS